MRTIIVTSTRPYTGKSGITLALLRELEARGLDAGYFKPYGTMPVADGDVLTDEDALYINRTLARPSESSDVCPVVRTQGLVERVLSGEVDDLRDEASAAFARCAQGRDVMVVEGPTDPMQGAAVRLCLSSVATLLDAGVLLVDRPEPGDLPEDALDIAERLHGRMHGVILNAVDESQSRFVTASVVPFLERRGVPVFGVLAKDPILSSVSVMEIVEALGGTVLSAEDRLGDQVESFMVGAMGQDKALRFFRRKAAKAVITGGDRADVQLAALETNTRCIILTGNMPPSSVVLARSEELGVPMILVDTDTLTAVERLEALMGRTRLHDAGKAARIRAMFEQEVDRERLLTSFGVGL